METPMGFDQKVWKGTTLGLIFLVLFSLNAAAWSPDNMKADMDQKFDSKFGSGFDENFEQTTQSVENDDSTSDRQVRQSSSLDSSYWTHFQQELDRDLNRDSDRTSDDSDSSTDDRTTDRQTRDSSDDSTGDSSSDDSSNTVRPSGSTEQQAEEYLHQYINDERQKRGLSPLNFNSELRSTAQEKSSDMANRGYFSHNDPEGDNFRDIYNQNGISRSECRVGGENIARTWFNRNVRTDTGSTVNYDNAQELADGLRRQWMTSSAHRDAILRERYNDHGLGVEITSSGRVYATEHFCA